MQKPRREARDKDHGCEALWENEVEDVPGKDDIVTSVSVIDEGHLLIPSMAGWGTDLDEDEIARHPWKA